MGGALLDGPVALSRGRLPVLTLAVYQAGSLVCHQRPERSFHLAGVQLPVCARCFGLYLSGAVGLACRVAHSADVLRARGADAAGAGGPADRDDCRARVAGAIETSNVQRMLTGLPLGFAAGVVIVRSLGPAPGDAI